MERIEVITGVQRRRRYTADEKAALVAECIKPGMSVSLVARRHGISASLLFKWKKLMNDGGYSAIESGDEVVSASEVQEKFMVYGIKFRPNKPGSPHLNGKVERSQKTDKTEFYITVDLTAVDLDVQLAHWQHYYNWDRPHSAHNGKSPMDRYFELINHTPFSDEVAKDYQPESERIQNPNYKVDLELQRLKRSL